MDYSNYIKNKQITLESIKKIADYLEELKIRFEVQFERKEIDEHTNDKTRNYNSITINLKLRPNEAYISGNEMRQENITNKIYNNIMSILQENEDKWNKTIKRRKIKTFLFCTSVGIIFTYLIYIILKINYAKLPNIIIKILNEKTYRIIIQWVFAIISGYLLSGWYISNLYKTIMPRQHYSGYNRYIGRSEYKDDVSSYINESEVQFGKYWDAKNKRDKIERISRISIVIVVIQIIINMI